MLAIRTILHPTDFSESSAYAFDLACSLARDYGARLVLVHIREVPILPYGNDFGTLPVQAFEPEALEKELAGLEPTCPGLTVERKVIQGDAGKEIVALAKETKCDLIVMGTHGRTGLGRLLMGSVAEQIVRRAPCPVLTVKMPADTQASSASRAKAGATA
jgi:nucleotide-binding universal stress UspA family protein